MKLTVRRGVFETNSSSSHSLTIVDKQTFEDWKSGKLLYCEYGAKGEQFVPFNESLIADQDSYVEVWTYEMFQNMYDYGMDGMEAFEQEETMPSGEKVVAFGYYGYAG